MKLRKDLNSLTALSLEVPALSEEKEGLLKGGFCAVATVSGIGLQSENSGSCNEGCNVGCFVSCVYSDCVDNCKEGCNNACNDGCKDGCPEEPTDPEGGEDTSKAVNPGAILMGFSLVF